MSGVCGWVASGHIGCVCVCVCVCTCVPVYLCVHDTKNGVVGGKEGGGSGWEGMWR